MKLAVVGKGGSGKTTTSAVLARTLARQGHQVVALDCDSNPNLGISLGIGEDETERLVAMRQALEDGEGEHAPGWEDLLDRFGAEGPDGVRLAVVTRIDNPEPGCPCCGLSPEQLLGNVDAEGIVVIADLEAGIGTLTRLSPDVIDAVVIVVESTPRSIEVGVRAAALAVERGFEQLVVVANRVRGEQDIGQIKASFPGAHVVIVPDDLAIVEADRFGLAPLDRSPDAPAVRALVELAEGLLAVPA